MHLKYVTKTSSGTYEFRRQVPADLRAAVGKRELKKVLGTTDAQAMAAYSKAFKETQRILDKAKAPRTHVQLTRTAMMDYQEALRRVEALGLNPMAKVFSEDGGIDDQSVLRDVASEQIANKYPTDDEGYPAITCMTDAFTVALIQGGPKVKAPEPTIDDAVRIYITEKHLLEPAAKKQLLQVQLVASEIKTALGGRNPTISSLKRQDARDVRDYMLTEKERQPESVDRYLNTVRAIINLAIKEFDLECGNSFMGLEVKKDPIATRKSKRVPLPADVLTKVTDRLRDAASEELSILWDMLAGTGCRPNEVAGLRVSDLQVDTAFPHIRIEWHENRRVKDEITQRLVPLVGDALDAAKRALALSKIGKRHKDTAAHMLFPNYGRIGGAGAASQAIISKHMRLFTTNPKHVLYSLRHNAKDNLRKALVPLEVQNMILGHTNGGVGEGYGGEEAVLEVTTAAMAKAFLKPAKIAA